MQVKAATFTSSLQIHCEGTYTDGAKAVLGRVNRGNALKPGVGLSFFGYELSAAVLYNTQVVEADLGAGILTTIAGSPVIYQGAAGEDWEGILVPTQLGVRALLIEDFGGGTGSRQVRVELDGGEVIKIPHGGHLLMVAPEGKLLPAEWNTLQFGTDTAAQQAQVRISVLTEYGD